MGNKVFITGVGVISAIGNNVEETLDALMHARSGIGPLELIQTRHKEHIPVGEVKLDNEQLIRLLGLAPGTKITRTTLLGAVAAKEALRSAGISDVNEKRTGIVSATSVGGMAITENLYKDYLNSEKTGNFLEFINLHECGDSTEGIADILGIKDHLSTISTACSSSANSIMFGARLIKHGIVDRVVVGGTDSLSRFTINGFMTLMILDKEHCKPFDANRKGLNLGEGAGFVVLESEAASAGKKRLCELSGYGNSNDAYHQTASSPEGEGALLAMKKALEVSGLQMSDIDYINAHGTGTEINDLSEGTAVSRLFGDHVPPISSTKAFTGHTLGACGGIEAVFSVLAIQHGIIPPNLNFHTPMPELNFRPVTELQTHQPINHVLSNSFGFGGNTSALIFSKVN